MSKVNPNFFTTRPEIEGVFGVVASTHWIATVLAAGGAAGRAGLVGRPADRGLAGRPAPTRRHQRGGR
jgi:hypothetical protein